MKARCLGCGGGYVKPGGIYDAEYLSDKEIKVVGKNFLYTFTYNSKSEMDKEWKEE